MYKHIDVYVYVNVYIYHLENDSVDGDFNSFGESMYIYLNMYVCIYLCIYLEMIE
jgi:hypothetical protein